MIKDLLCGIGALSREGADIQASLTSRLFSRDGVALIDDFYIRLLPI